MDGNNGGGLQLVLTNAIRLEASSACQLRCPSCPTTMGLTDAVIGKASLRLADFVKLIDDNPWVGQVELSNYGEVFLNPELLDIFSHAFARNVTLTLANGVNLNHAREDVLEGLVRWQIAAITCSIDGASQATYEIYRQRGNFDRVIGHLRRINAFKKAYNSERPRLCWQFVAFGHNEHEVERARELASELGMEFSVKLNWDPDMSPVTNEDLIRVETGTGAATRQEYLEQTGTAYMESICDQLWSAPQVNWNGKLLGCCRNFWGDFGGNAFRDGLIASLNHDKIAYARQMLEGRQPARDDIPCTTCELYTARRSAGRWRRPRAPIATSDERFIGATITRALAAAERGHLDEAAAWARMVLQLRPQHGSALGVLSRAAEHAGRAEAAQYYREKAAAGASGQRDLSG